MRMREEKYFSCFVVFALLMGFCGRAIGSSDVQIDISPTQVVEGDGNKVEIMCSAVALTEVLVISVTHDNHRPVVLVRNRDKVTFYDKSRGQIEAKGLVSAVPGESFLYLAIKSPIAAKDNGLYECKFHSLDENKSMEVHTATATLTVRAPPPPPPQTGTTRVPTVPDMYTAETILYNLLDRIVQVELNGQLQPYWVIGLTDQERRDLMKDVRENKTQVIFDKDSLDMKLLTDRLAKMESLVYTQMVAGNGSRDPSGATPTDKTDNNLLYRVETLEQENKNISQQIQRLSEKAIPNTNTTTITNDVIKRVTTLESRLSQLQTTLHNKGSSGIAFHSTFNQQQVHVKKGMTLVFPEILTSKGQGYDRKTGVFTAPIDGIYGFHLKVDNIDRGTCRLALKADKSYFSMMTTGNSEDQGQSSVSSVVNLKAGQQVKVIAVDLTGSVSLRGYSYSTFTGYLIWS